MTLYDAPAIMWFRNDQRLTDNPALQAACQHRFVAPLFVWAPEEESPWQPGEASNWWLHRSLEDLDASLNNKRSFLSIFKGDSINSLRKIIDDTGASAVYWNRRYELAIIKRDAAIKKELSGAGIHAESFNGSLLNEPWEVLKKDGTPYQVYTPYWKAARAKVTTKDIGKRLKLPPPPPKLDKKSDLKQLGLNPDMPWGLGFQKFWQPGEPAGKKLIRQFVKGGLTSYNKGRDIPAKNGTSLMSPYLHFGNISPKQIWAAAYQRPTNNPNTVQYLKELVWREFAAQLLYHFPHMTKEPLRDAFKKFPWKRSKKNLKAWQKGLTGYPIVDAGMRQLWHIGWMHNRVRMITASFLVKDYQIKWQEGATWFWDTLVDADLASNTMGWQWVAGCGADAAPYFRIFNPMLQGSRFDPEGKYIRQWVPELKNLPNKWIHSPWEAPVEELKKAGVTLGKDYPKPSVDHFEAKVEALMAYDQIKAKK